jgi:hypothetical protein
MSVEGIQQNLIAAHTNLGYFTKDVENADQQYGICAEVLSAILQSLQDEFPGKIQDAAKMFELGVKFLGEANRTYIEKFAPHLEASGIAAVDDPHAQTVVQKMQEVSNMLRTLNAQVLRAAFGDSIFETHADRMAAFAGEVSDPCRHINANLAHHENGVAPTLLPPAKICQEAIMRLRGDDST